MSNKIKMSELDPAQDMVNRIKNNVPNLAVYKLRDLPSSKLPDAYVTVGVNGSINRLTTSDDLYRTNLLIAVNVRLLTTGGINDIKEKKIIEQIEDLFNGDGYSKRVNFVYEGKNLVANYSTKMFNIITRITNN